MARVRLAACVTLFAATIAAPAGAVDASKPFPCGGEPLLTDPAGDQVVDPSGQGAPTRAGDDNMDIRSVFLNYRTGADGKPALTANIEVANLDAAVPAPLESQAGLYYYVHYTLGGMQRFVKAVNRGDGDVTYWYGFLDPDTVPGFVVYNTEGDTRGVFFEGPGGVVQIEVPDVVGGKPGVGFTGVAAHVDTITGLDDYYGVNAHADVAPDSGTGRSYTVETCDALEARRSLPLGLPKSLGSARRANEAKALRLRVRAAAPIAELAIRLRDPDGRVVGTGRLKEASGAATVPVKVNRKLREGAYALVATGTVEGEQRSVTAAARLEA